MNFNKIISFMKERFFLLVSLAGVVFIVLLILFLVLRSTPQKDTSGIKPLPMPSDPTQDYSNLYRLVPGKSTLEDVKKINGEPYNVTVFGENTYLYYKTPLKTFLNKVLIRNNKVVYSYEYVYGKYRGDYNSFINSYGEAPLKMYERENSPWYIYPNKGIGFQSDRFDVLAVIYFVPMTKEEFIKNIAPDINLLTEEPPVSE